MSDPQMESDSLGVRRTQNQVTLDATNRKKTLAELLGFVREQGMRFADVVELANVLGVDGELDDLVAQLPERHRRKVDVAAVRLELGLLVDESAVTSVTEPPGDPS